MTAIETALIVAYIYLVANIFTSAILGYAIYSRVKYALSRRIKTKRNEEGSEEVDRKNIAVLIPAWDEGVELQKTLDYLLNKPVKRVIVATYPNDAKTLRALEPYKEKIDIIVNSVNGPTNKFQNLCYAFSEIKKRYTDYSYILILDAEVRPSENYFDVVKRYLRKDTILQTRVIAYPFYSKNLFEEIMSRMYFVASLHIQEIIDKSRTKMGRNIFLKGAGMVFPIHSLDALLEICRNNKNSFWDKLTKLAEDTELAILLSTKYRYRIIFIDETYTWEEAPHRLSVIIKRYARWFKGNFANLIKYHKIIIRNFTHYFLIGLQSVLLPLTYVVLFFTLYYLLFPPGRAVMHPLIFYFNAFFALYYLIIPPLLATLFENKLKMPKKRFSLIKNFIAHSVYIFIIPVPVILGFYDILRKKTYWYKTERS